MSMSCWSLFPTQTSAGSGRASLHTQARSVLGCYVRVERKVLLILRMRMDANAN